MRDLIRWKGAEWLICTCIAAAMTDAVCAGFLLDHGPGVHILPMFLLGGTVTALLLWVAGSRTRIRAGLIGGGMLFFGLVFYMNVTHPLTDETENGTFIFFLIGIIVSILCFLMSRTRPGTIALFLIGLLIQSGSHFLQFPAAAWSFLVFLAGMAMLYLYRVYMHSLGQAELGQAGVEQYLLQSAAVCMAAVLLAGGIFAAVIRPLSPPTQELKLIRVFEQMEIFKVLGISTTLSVLDPNMGSEQDPDSVEDAENPGEQESDSIEEQQKTEEEDSLRNRLQNQFTSIRYDWMIKAFKWMLLLLPLLIAAAYGLRVKRHRDWLAKVKSLSREDAVLNYYSFFYKRIQKAGLRKTDASTLREYAADMEHALESFDHEDAVFGKLTGVYEKVLYGHSRISEEELGLFEKYYDGFFERLRHEVGPVKYYLTAFRY